MTSTRADDASPQVREFFFAELLPLAEKLRAEGKYFFSVKPDPGVQTYYVTRDKRKMNPEDFEAAGCESEDSLEKAFVALWTS